jgi:hypothetical protein
MKSMNPLKRRTLLGSVALLLATANALALSPLDAISQRDRSAALRTALTQGAQQAIGKLGVTDGFLGNSEVKIALPGKLQKADRLLRMLGLGPKADELVTAMNRAAEAAVPEARTLLTDSIKQMSITDAVGILTGGQDAATQYFRRTTSTKLTERFLPIVHKNTAKLDLAKRYNDLGGQLAQYQLIDSKDASIDSYVTQKALDGLFLMMAKEEASIRSNPLEQGSKLLKKVFGALGQ